MAKQPTPTEVIVVGFNYDLFDTKVAEKIQSAAERIRSKVKRTLDDLIEVGRDLQSVKDAIPHGQFSKWLKIEFGWGERMAQNFLSVAAQFGPKSEMIADLSIAPTAAYLLAAPSVPEAARVQAIERAEAGEKITTVVAKEILAEARRKDAKKPGRAAAGVLTPKLLAVLERFRQRWSTKELAELAGQLRQFADKIDEQQQQRTARKAKKG